MELSIQRQAPMAARKRARRRDSAWLLVLVFCCAAATYAEGVRVAGSTWVADAPTQVAHASGYFNADPNGPRVKVELRASGSQALDSLLAGEAEFALAASTPIAAALLRTAADSDPAIVLLGSVSRSNATHLIVADAAAGIRRPSDLAGRRVAVMTGTSAHFGWDQFARHHGFKAADVIVVPIAVDQQERALLDGQVQAAVTWEPWSTGLRAVLGERAALFDTRHLFAVSWLLITRPDVLRNHPGLAERVLLTYSRAIDDLERDLQAAMAMHSDGTSTQTSNSGDAVIWGLRLDWALIADIETRFTWWIDSGQAPQARRPSPAQYLLASPLRTISPRSVVLPDYLFKDPVTVP